MFNKNKAQFEFLVYFGQMEISQIYLFRSAPKHTKLPFWTPKKLSRIITNHLKITPKSHDNFDPKIPILKNAQKQ